MWGVWKQCEECGNNVRSVDTMWGVWTRHKEGYEMIIITCFGLRMELVKYGLRSNSKGNSKGLLSFLVFLLCRNLFTWIQTTMGTRFKDSLFVPSCAIPQLLHLSEIIIINSQSPKVWYSSNLIASRNPTATKSSSQAVVTWFSPQRPAFLV